MLVPLLLLLAICSQGIAWRMSTASRDVYHGSRQYQWELRAKRRPSAGEARSDWIKPASSEDLKNDLLAGLEMEELLELAAAESSMERRRKQQEKEQEARERMKRKKDREYEAYWRRQTKELSPRDIYRSYYGLSDEESVSQRTLSASDDDEQWLRAPAADSARRPSSGGRSLFVDGNKQRLRISRRSTATEKSQATVATKVAPQKNSDRRKMLEPAEFELTTSGTDFTAATERDGLVEGDGGAFSPTAVAGGFLVFVTSSVFISLWH